MSNLNDTSAHLPPAADIPFGLVGPGDPRRPALLFLVLGVAGVALLAPVLLAFPGTDHDYQAATRGITAAWLQVVGGLALAAAGLALAIVVTRLTRIAQSVAGGDYGAVARSAATVHATVIGVSAAALSSNAVARVLHADPGAGSAVAPRLGFILLTVPGAVAAAVAVFGTAFAVWRAGRISTGLAIAGFAVSALLLAGLLIVPIALLPLWLLAAAFTIRR